MGDPGAATRVERPLRASPRMVGLDYLLDEHMSELALAEDGA